MKKIIMLFVLIISAVNASAQDVIVKKDGNTVISKVVEVSTTEIKYKKWSNQDGPTYTIPISDVYAINYANGEREEYSNAAQPQQNNIYRSQQQATTYNTNYSYPANTYNGYTKEELLKSAKKWHRASNVWGTVFSIAGVGAGIFLTNNDTGLVICLCSGLASGVIVGRILDSVGDRRERAAAKLTSSHLFQQDLNLNHGNTRLSAGLDLMNDRITNIHTLGVGISLNF